MGSTGTPWGCSTPAEGEGLHGAGRRLQHWALPALPFPTHRAPPALCPRLPNTGVLRGTFLQPPLPPAAPTGAPAVGTRGCLSPEPRQVPLKLLLLSLEVLDVFHLGTTRRHRGTSARGTGSADPASWAGPTAPIGLQPRRCSQTRLPNPGGRKASPPPAPSRGQPWRGAGRGRAARRTLHPGPFAAGDKPTRGARPNASTAGRHRESAAAIPARPTPRQRHRPALSGRGGRTDVTSTSTPTPQPWEAAQGQQVRRG